MLPEKNFWNKFFLFFILTKIEVEGFKYLEEGRKRKDYLPLDMEIFIFIQYIPFSKLGEMENENYQTA